MFSFRVCFPTTSDRCAGRLYYYEVFTSLCLCTFEKDSRQKSVHLNIDEIIISAIAASALHRLPAQRQGSYKTLEGCVFCLKSLLVFTGFRCKVFFSFFCFCVSARQCRRLHSTTYSGLAAHTSWEAAGMQALWCCSVRCDEASAQLLGNVFFYLLHSQRWNHDEVCI